MLCKDCDKSLPYSTIFIRCKKCYAIMKQKENSLTMKCLDCKFDIPKSFKIVRCMPCFIKMKNPKKVDKFCHHCRNTGQMYACDDVYITCVHCCCMECEMRVCCCFEGFDDDDDDNTIIWDTSETSSENLKNLIHSKKSLL